MTIVGALIVFLSLKLRRITRVAVEEVTSYQLAESMRSSIDCRKLESNEDALPARYRATFTINDSGPNVVARRLMLATREVDYMRLQQLNMAGSCDNGETVVELCDLDASISRNSWTPADGYGADHQAAIEAALSTVLTVSTLVGFRSEQTNRNHCCLHHAVQVSNKTMLLASAQNHNRQ